MSAIKNEGLNIQQALKSEFDRGVDVVVKESVAGATRFVGGINKT